jgi:tetratricopeptide (TPR) repeat protein
MAEASDGNLERAAELMLAAADADPTDWRLPNEAGVFYFQVARYEDALRCYDRTLTIVPDDVPVLMNRALAFVLMGDDAGARAALQKVFAVDPIHAPAFFELGKLHQKAGEHEDALQCFDTALAHETMSTLWNAAGAPPRNMRLVFLVMLNKARAYFALDRADDGASQAQSLWNEFRDPDALLKLARELAAQARDADAGRVADIVLADHPDHAEARRFRAEL